MGPDPRSKSQDQVPGLGSFVQILRAQARALAQAQARAQARAQAQAQARAQAGPKLGPQKSKK